MRTCPARILMWLMAGLTMVHVRLSLSVFWRVALTGNDEKLETVRAALHGQDRDKHHHHHPLFDSVTPHYDQIYRWFIRPDNQDFHQIPYRQLCHWRNRKISQQQGYTPMGQWQPQLTLAGNVPSHNATILLQVQFDCYRTMKESPFGTGNWVQMLLLLRHAVLATVIPEEEIPVQMDVQLTCVDETSESSHKVSLVMPWLMGHFSSNQTIRLLKRHFWKHVPNEEMNLDCHTWGWGDTPVGWMLPFIQQDLRRMAISLMGLPNDTSHPAHEWYRQNQHTWAPSHPDRSYYRRPAQLGRDTDNFPLIPNVELDDVVIHFRCGDTMVAKETYFRFLKFKEYASRIDPSVKSIGIVTQSFGPSAEADSIMDEQARARDQDDIYRVNVCRAVVHRFVGYLQQKFPDARIRIHNGKFESVALAFARLIMAKKQAFAYPDSSFSVYPVLATFGTGFHMKPTRSPYKQNTIKNEWLAHMRQPLAKVDSANIQFMNIPKEEALFSIETLYMKVRNETSAAADILEWFANDTFSIPRVPYSKLKMLLDE